MKDNKLKLNDDYNTGLIGLYLYGSAFIFILSLKVFDLISVSWFVLLFFIAFPYILGFGIICLLLIGTAIYFLISKNKK